ncbi:MAG: tRNA (adenosine(37)-N6)-threonylcarbamoyltransferase complex dimerization subunit type 1 TsaB [Lactobacillales bacterium]|jgi:tRNA threonylcarbamoyl adenosine modification protein YeaZ|nr:tRNA (adenosine(37)-N6)-threonylcarbamoyltransferase complex dimerization subunit type 1 TsaB [Lactobacillales bacterium]
MLTLAIDTSSSYISVALLAESDVVQYVHLEMQTGQSEALFPAIQKLFDGTRYTQKDLTQIAVAVGPGSYTGVRIGLSTARGLSLALGIPVIGVTNFAAWSYGLMTPVRVTLDTRRGEYYTQSFDGDGNETSEPAIVSLAQLEKMLPFTAVGDAARDVAEKIKCDSVEKVSPAAVSIGKYAVQYPQKGKSAEPLYLREADVTVCA